MSQANHAAVVATLEGRWPEHRVAPSLGRIDALMDVLGRPERAAPVISITGTNGKGSTAIMIDALLRASGLRVGRFASPHLQDVTERISIDGAPISTERFDEIWDEIEPLVAMVDERAIDGVMCTFFEVLTAMAYVAFADAPVDVAVMEVGMGGRWDATSVADAAVAVVAPIDLDHTQYLGDTIAKIAAEKAGIIKAEAVAVLAGQTPEAAQVLAKRCLDVGAKMVREGQDFGLLERELAAGGQVIRLLSSDGPVGDLFLPLHGAHMAHNAALAVAACEALLGRALDPEVIQQGFDDVVAPARLELVHDDPPVVLDTAHNPHGVRATLAGVEEAFAFAPLIAVLAMMADKAVLDVLDLLEPEVATLVVT
ncbi:MAG: Mur ligase family protein, partial [Propionibacteriaceae bacterium]|nr:Mur ligase family protein [Propionibacteriaceae bacterium]